MAKKRKIDFSDIFGSKKDEDQDDFFGSDDEGIPEGCAACGGDWPNCTTSCPLYDD